MGELDSNSPITEEDKKELVEKLESDEEGSLSGVFLFAGAFLEALGFALVFFPVFVVLLFSLRLAGFVGGRSFF